MDLGEIVAKEARAESNVRFVFPSLTSLTLWELPHLRTFYRGIYILEWPVLKNLKVYGCDKVCSCQNVLASRK